MSARRQPGVLATSAAASGPVSVLTVGLSGSSAANELASTLVRQPGRKTGPYGCPPTGFPLVCSLTLTSAETVDAAVRLIYARPASELR
jgi:hypothetical protein